MAKANLDFSRSFRQDAGQKCINDVILVLGKEKLSCWQAIELIQAFNSHHFKCGLIRIERLSVHIAHRDKVLAMIREANKSLALNIEAMALD